MGEREREREEGGKKGEGGEERKISIRASWRFFPAHFEKKLIFGDSLDGLEEVGIQMESMTQFQLYSLRPSDRHLADNKSLTREELKFNTEDFLRHINH